MLKNIVKWADMWASAPLSVFVIVQLTVVYIHIFHKYGKLNSCKSICVASLKNKKKKIVYYDLLQLVYLHADFIWTLKYTFSPTKTNPLNTLPIKSIIRGP